MRKPEITKPGGNRAMWEPFTVLNRTAVSTTERE